MRSNSQPLQRGHYLRLGCGRAIEIIMLLGVLLATTVHATISIGDPDNYRKLMTQLNAGDTLLLRPGTYTLGLPIHRMEGNTDRPIVITGMEGEPRPLFLARRGRNTISIVDSAYVHIRNLELDGQGLPVDGVKAEGHSQWAHHITLENLLIRGHGNNQQTVGISTKCPAWNWTIRNNLILGAGTGMYLGDSDGSAPFFAGLIEHNRIIDSTGYDLQIKHQLAQPELSGLTEGGRGTTIRQNVFIKTKASTEEGMARPSVLVGHWPLSGPGSGAIYQIYGNLFYDNPSEALFQGEGNIGLYGNYFINPNGDAIHIQPHNDVPKRVDIFDNTIVATGAGITVRRKENDFRYQQHLVANTVFASPALTGGVQESNLTGSYDEAGDYLVSPFGGLEQLNLSPKAGQLASDQSDLSRFDHYLDWNKGFNWEFRNHRPIGP